MYPTWTCVAAQACHEQEARQPEWRCALAPAGPCVPRAEAFKLNYVSSEDLDELRQVDHVVRLGRVRGLSGHQLVPHCLQLASSSYC